MSQVGTGFGSLTSTSAGQRNGTDGFFGTVLKGLEQGLYKIGSEVLPNWTNAQLKVQSSDQLAKGDTYNQLEAAPRLQQAYASPTTGLQEGLSKPLFSIGGVTISPLSILFIAGGFLALSWAVRKL